MLSLQRGYLEHLKKLLVEIVLVKNLMGKDSLEPEHVLHFYRMIHNVCGSGATFGFPTISTTGQVLTNRLKPMLEMGADVLRLSVKEQFLQQEMEIFERACHQVMLSDAQALAHAPSLLHAREQPEESKTVCIYSPQEAALRDIDEQLRHFGYRVFISHDMPSFTEAVRANTPDVVIAQSDMSEASLGALKALHPDIGAANANPQLILIADNDDFEARLAAVRLGAKGYFTLPVDVLQVIDKIELLMASSSTAVSYHVLIVDDDEMLMKFYTHALTRAGIITTSVSSPKEALEVIADQAIDLILIDFLMPYCNGQELATIIRQHEKYVSMPIIFTSSRDDVESLLINTGLGIDDFLVKPITGDQLVSVVRSRAQRSAELQVLMARDSFTGLLNHGHFMDMLAMELGQVRRYKTHGAYALIDIDNFKSINDTYGHIAGDHVIKGLSRMLQQRLRRSDIIGRCGGEEFGIIMPDCDMGNASLILESLRLQFSDLSFRIDQHDIRVTFSAGLSQLEAHEDVDALIKATDMALYEAKNQGRNRLIIA
jgi:diguanylate cyclase (GGDEF)-like protein